MVKWCGITGYQLWSVERLENKLVDLRDLYNEKILLQQQRQQLSATTNLSCSSSSIDCNNEDDNSFCYGSLFDLNIDKEDNSRRWDRQSPLHVFSTLFESQVIFAFVLRTVFL